MIALSACIVGAPGLIGVQVRELRAADNRRGPLAPESLPVAAMPEAAEGQTP
jgi:hypothetical protein